MKDISERIKKIIAEEHIRQTDFAKMLNLSQPFVSALCSGSKIPSERTISDICRVFSVSEMWLCEGIGEMYRKPSVGEELSFFFADLTDGPPGFQQAFVSVLSRMTPEEWAMLERKARELLAELTRIDEEEAGPE